jgi:AraC family transcriptional regulator
MILKGYPDYTKEGFDINAPCPEWKWPNMIIHNKTTSADYPMHTGPLTLKFTLKGAEFFKTPERDYTVEAGSYLIINQGQKYSCRIASRSEVETISVFFRPKFAEEVLASLVTPEDKLLEFKETNSELPVHFAEKIYEQNSFITTSIMKFKIASENNLEDEDWFEDEFFTLLKNMLVLHRVVNKEVENVSSAKLSTKWEIYRRAHVARDYIDEHFSEEIKLEDVAKASCLSLYHFIRIFKNIFKETPRQYIIKKRLEKASALLMHSEVSITDVCFDVGFKSLSSFSWLFKQKFGMYPEQLRHSYQYFQTSFKNLKV